MTDFFDAPTIGEVLRLLQAVRDTLLQSLSDSSRQVFDFYFQNFTESLLARDLSKPLTPEDKQSLQESLGFIISQEISQASRNLPLYSYKRQILETLYNSSFLVLTADTGAGKSTQLVQYLALDSTICQEKTVICTQPRKIAASSLCKRVSIETGYKVGCCYYSSEVLSTGIKPRIIYMTENCLLNALLEELNKEIPMEWCNVIIIDEAHERSVECEILFGLVKKFLYLKRKDMKFIITSATINCESFSGFFFNCPILNCPGRCYPVNIHYSKSYNNYILELQDTLQRVILGKLSYIYTYETILVFLVGRDQFQSTLNYIKNKISYNLPPNTLEICELYGRMDQEEQEAILSSSQSATLRVILCTNVAETSLTISNVTCIIDCGREKRNIFRSDKGINDLTVRLISKDSARQRAGRAGRVCEGDCYRIFTEEEFQEMSEMKEPAILITHIGLVLLKFSGYGLNFNEVPLLDKPDMGIVLASYKELFYLRALELRNAIVITEIGKFIEKLEVEPMIGKILYSSVHEFRCMEEGIVIACLLKACSFIFEKFEDDTSISERIANDIINDIINSLPSEPSQFPANNELSNLLIMTSIKKFFETNYLRNETLASLGDYLIGLFCYRQWEFIRCVDCIIPKNQLPHCKTCKSLRSAWSKKFNVVNTNMFATYQLKRELLKNTILSTIPSSSLIPSDISVLESQLAILSAYSTESSFLPRLYHLFQDTIRTLPSTFENILNFYAQHLFEPITKVVCSALFMNLCRYRGIRDKLPSGIEVGYMRLQDLSSVLPHPSSVYARRGKPNTSLIELHGINYPPDYLIFHSFLYTNKPYMKLISPIKYEWLSSLASEWLEHAGIDKSMDEYSEYIIDNTGPALLDSLVGRHGNLIYKIEEDIHSLGGVGTVIMLDSKSYQIKLYAPASVFHIARREIERILQIKRQEVYSQHTIQVSYGSQILQIEPGGMVQEISNLAESICYKMVGISPSTTLPELTQQLRNTFDFYFLTLSRSSFQSSKTAYVYFRTQAEADTALKALNKKPLPGQTLLINNLLMTRYCISNKADKTIKLKVPTEYLESLQTFSTYFGDIIYFTTNLKGSFVTIFLKYKYNESVENFRMAFKTWCKECLGRWSERFIELLDDGILVPKELLQAAKHNFYHEIKRIESKYEVKIFITGEKNVRLSILEQNEEAAQEISSLLMTEYVPYTSNMKEEIESGKIDGLSWSEWQEQNEVVAKIISAKSVISIYGLPASRSAARSALEREVHRKQSTILTHDLSYSTKSDLDKIYKLASIHRIKATPYTYNKLIKLEGNKDDIFTILQALQKPNLSSSQICEVCYDALEFQNTITLSLCGHKQHTHCLRRQILCTIREKPFPVLPLCCIYCRALISYTDWFKALDETDTQELYHASLTLLVAGDKRYAWCENPTCGYVYSPFHFKQKKQSIRLCPNCKGRYCLRCKKPALTQAHEVRCEIYWMEDHAKENIEWLKENTKNCPRCEFRVEKNGGCNHMKCAKCGCHYCFLCLEIICPNSPVTHFSDPSKSCYRKYLVV